MSATTRTTQFPTAVKTAFTGLKTSWDAWQRTPNKPLDSVRDAFTELQETVAKHQCSLNLAPLRDRLTALNPKEVSEVHFAINRILLSLNVDLFPESAWALIFAHHSDITLKTKLVEQIAKALSADADLAATTPEAQRAEAAEAINNFSSSPEMDEVISKVVEKLKAQGKWIAALHICMHFTDSGRKAQKDHLASIPPEIAYREVLHLIYEEHDLAAYKLAMALPDADKRRALLPLRDLYETSIAGGGQYIDVINIVLAGLPSTTSKIDTKALSSLLIASEAPTIASTPKPTSPEEQRAEAVAFRKSIELQSSPEQDKLLCEKIEQLKKEGKWTAALHLCFGFSDSARNIQEGYIISVPRRVVHVELLYLMGSNKLYVEGSNRLYQEMIVSILAKGLSVSVEFGPNIYSGWLLAPEERVEAASIRQQMGFLCSPEKDQLLCEKIEQLKKEGKWTAALHLCMTFSAKARKLQEDYIASIPKDVVQAELSFWLKEDYSLFKFFKLAMRLPYPQNLEAFKFIKLNYPPEALSYQRDVLDAAIASTMPVSLVTDVLFAESIRASSFSSPERNIPFVGTEKVPSPAVPAADLSFEKQKSEVDQIDKKHRDNPLRSEIILKEVERLLRQKKYIAAINLCLFPVGSIFNRNKIKELISKIPLQDIYREITRFADGGNMGFTLAMLLPENVKVGALKHLRESYNKMPRPRLSEIDEIDAIIKGLEASTPQPAAQKASPSESKERKREEKKD